MTEDELKHDLTGEIFKIPHTENDYQTASEYLSGDIRKKLREAEEIAPPPLLATIEPSAVFLELTAYAVEYFLN